jgi:pimeloyl-ACP methyl ester carboxylesterase
MPYAVNAKARRIHYETFGSEGPVVVLIMGIGVSGRFWLTIPKTLASDPAQPRRVIVIDNRGTGQSDKPFTPWTMAHMADDVATVLDAVRVQKADVVGISMGGMVAQHVALRHPDRVSGLVLMCTFPGLPLGRLPSPRAVYTLVKGFAGGMKGSEFQRLVYPDSQMERVKELIKQGIWREAVKAEVFDLRTVIYQLLAVATHYAGHRLHTITCPTVVVTGTDDRLIPPENSRRMARRIKGAVLTELPEVGHDMITLAPDAALVALHQLDELRSQTGLRGPSAPLAEPAPSSRGA